VREFQSATLGFSSSAGVMSDIVKRRSIRAFGAAVKGRGRRAISMHLLRRKPQSGAKSAKLDRIAVGSIL
jgi:hypothetical protein